MELMSIAPYTVNEVHKTINFCVPKGIMQMNCEEMWEQGYTGKDVVVAVLDTGCDVNHPCLKDRIIGVKNFTKGNSDDVHDSHGHGTHVSGIIAGNRIEEGVTGVAPDSKLLIVKVLGDNGDGSITNVIDGINYAVSQKVDIINLSLGGKQDTPLLKKAIQNAVMQGISVVVASGNNGDGNALTNEIMYPAYYQEVIEVGAINFADSMARFSNSNSELDVCCYGVEITSTYPKNTYARCSGTSQATPHVSGALALLKQKFVTENNRQPTEDELYKSLLKHLSPIPNVSKNLQGNGKVQF